MYEKWCSPKSNRIIPLRHQAFMQQHMNPRKEALPDRISVAASWEEVQAWSKAFKDSDDADLQSWMLRELNEAAELWKRVNPDELISHRPRDISAASVSESRDAPGDGVDVA